MFSASATYLNHISTSRTRRPKSKVVIDGVTYTGESHLKTYPKISHSNSKMIGGFPAKTCEFEIYNLDGSISLNGIALLPSSGKSCVRRHIIISYFKMPRRTNMPRKSYLSLQAIISCSGGKAQ